MVIDTSAIVAVLLNEATAARIVQVIEQSPLIDLLISHVLPMRNATEAFELQTTGQCAKVMLQPWG